VKKHEFLHKSKGC